MHTFSTENLERVFSKPENDYNGFKQFMFDYTHGREVYDEDGNKVTNAIANKKINNVCFDILGFKEGATPTKREIKRAMRKHGVELMEVLEEVIDLKVSTGFKEKEFFNDFVDMRNLADGDRNDFWVNRDVILTVAKVSGDHHDLNFGRVCIV